MKWLKLCIHIFHSDRTPYKTTNYLGSQGSELLSLEHISINCAIYN